MAHPFFDALKYPWHRPEAVKLHDVLFKVFANPVLIDQIYNQCAPGLPPLALTAAPNIIWKEALENLTVTTGALFMLCQMHKANIQLNAAIQAVLDAVPAENKRVISDRIFILDRVNLRQQLSQLVPDDATIKVLLVRGGPQSGKSHGRHLFIEVAHDHGAKAVYITEGMVATVKHVILKLFTTLQASNEIPPEDTTDKAWYSTVCFKLQEVASRKGQAVWIAVDDLGLAPDGAPILETEIRKFFEQFALNMIDPEFSRWFRLMLIHYPDGPVPTKWESEIWTEDRPNETDIKQEHVEEFIHSWLTSRGRQIVGTQLGDMAHEVLANAAIPPANGEMALSRLRRINDELGKKISAIAGT